MWIYYAIQRMCLRWISHQDYPVKKKFNKQFIQKNKLNSKIHIVHVLDFYLVYAQNIFF